MDHIQIINLLRSHREELEHLGVTSLALFGSAVRDELRQDSDIDLLIEFTPPYTFKRYMQIKFFIEDLLHRPVDLVMPETLKERARPEVEKEAVYVT
jgi:predicted nucleotidyltransferase